MFIKQVYGIIWKNEKETLFTSPGSDCNIRHDVAN